MQEEVEQRIVSLMISCGKLGEQEFRKAVAKLLEQLKNDIAVAERLRITATTLDGILTVKGQGRRDE